MSAKRAILESILVMTAARCNIAPASERQANKAKNREGRSTGVNLGVSTGERLTPHGAGEVDHRVVLGLVGWAFTKYLALITELRFLLQRTCKWGHQ